MTCNIIQLTTILYRPYFEGGTGGNGDVLFSFVFPSLFRIGKTFQRRQRVVQQSLFTTLSTCVGAASLEEAAGWARPQLSPESCPALCWPHTLNVLQHLEACSIPRPEPAPRPDSSAQMQEESPSPEADMYPSSGLDCPCQCCLGSWGILALFPTGDVARTGPGEVRAGKETTLLSRSLPLLTSAEAGKDEADKRV